MEGFLNTKKQAIKKKHTCDASQVNFKNMTEKVKGEKLYTLSLGVVDSSSSSSEGGDSLVGVMLPSLSLSPPPSPARPEKKTAGNWSYTCTFDHALTAKSPH